MSKLATVEAPNSILIAWSEEDGAWLATALAPVAPVNLGLVSDGPTPAAALDALLEHAWCLPTHQLLARVRIEEEEAR